MKKILVALLSVTLIVSACYKYNCDKPRANGADKSSLVSTATITGMDERKCGCCWGWLIQIDGKEYKFDRIPEDCAFDIYNIRYPSTVKIEWKDATGNCSGQLIEVISISSI